MVVRQLIVELSRRLVWYDFKSFPKCPILLFEKWKFTDKVAIDALLLKCYNGDLWHQNERLFRGNFHYLYMELARIDILRDAFTEANSSCAVFEGKDFDPLCIHLSGIEIVR